MGRLRRGVGWVEIKKSGFAGPQWDIITTRAPVGANNMPVQVEEPSMGSLVVEVHPHRQHDVVAPVVLRLHCSFSNVIIFPCHKSDASLQNHDHDNALPDFLLSPRIALSSLLHYSPNRPLRK